VKRKTSLNSGVTWYGNVFSSSYK